MTVLPPGGYPEDALEHIRELVGMVVEHMAAEKMSFLTTAADLTLEC